MARPRPLILLMAVLLVGACHSAPRPSAAPPLRSSPLLILRHDIEQVLALPALERSYWGILVKSLRNDDTLYALNPDKLLMPGSALKVVTLAVAAEQLGWNFTYETSLVGAGPIDLGMLSGDLVVVGSGDPSLLDQDGMAARLFASWAETLKSKGVRVITGRIIGDDNAFDDEDLGAGWAWDDLAEGFAAGVSALQFNENAVSVTITPGTSLGSMAAVSMAPATSALLVQSDVITAAPGTAASIQARRLPGSPLLVLRGSVPVGGAPTGRTVSVDNPTLFFVGALRDALVSAGIDVRGPAVDIDDIPDAPSRDGATLLATYRSPPLSTLAVRMMKNSQNLYAETLLKTVGASLGAPTMENSREAARGILQRWGVMSNALVQVDGSGLSRYNYVTADALVTILSHVDRAEGLRDPFEQSLPIAGRDGTLAARLKDTAAEGRIRAKTGTLANVRALAGYTTSAGGEPLVFAIVGNNYGTTPDVIIAAIDAIALRLTEFRR